MQAKSSRWVDDPEIAQRAVVLQLLRDDHDEPWSRAELEAEAFDVPPTMLSEALSLLRAEGVIYVKGGGFLASRCAVHLDTLGMISL